MANFRERQAVEFGDGGGDVLEDLLDEVLRSAGEVAEDFPIVACLRGRLDGAVEALEAAGKVDHGAALLREGRAGQDDVAGIRCRPREELDRGDELRFREVVSGETGFGGEILAEDEKGFHCAGADALADRCERCGWIFGRQDQLRAGGVRVAVCGDEKSVVFTLPGNDG